MQKAKWAILLGVIFIFAMLALPQPAYAASCPPESGASGYVVVPERNADISILPNGDVRYIETWVVNFVGTNFRFAFRSIPLNKATNITDWSVTEGGTVYTRSSSGEYVYNTSGISNDRTIHWCFPSTSNQTRTFTLSYTVEGSLAIYDDQDNYFWKFIESDRQYTIESSTVRVHLPSSVNPDQLELAGFVNGQSRLEIGEPGSVVPVNTPIARIIDSQTVEFSGGPFFGGSEWEIGVGFPHGLVSAEKQTWQTFEDNRSFLNLTALVTAVILTIGGGAGVYIFWYSRGRDKVTGVRAEYFPKPPEDIRPGLVGVLVDEVADMEDIMATLIDLARRGYLSITETEESGFGRKSEFVFEKQKSASLDLPKYEASLLSAVFGSENTRSLSSLKNKFYTSLPRIKNEMYEEITKYEYFQGNPEKVRQKYGCYGFVALLGFGLLAGLTYYVLGGLLGVFSEAFTICVSASLMVFPLGLLLISRVMPRKTAKGARAAMQWNAFKRYLKNIEKYNDVSLAEDQFEKYLPYAIAFGLEKSWVKKFEKTNVPVPMWYGPYTMNRPVSGGRGRAAGRPISQGGGAPSLDKAAGNVFGGLESMSTGLFTMLDQASSTFTSAPSSSGSGGGGGGFSGGGGGGGGSSGFG